MSQPLGSVTQIAYVVTDLDQTLEHWLRTKMAGPFYIAKGLPFANTRYRGAPTEVDVDVALSFSGNVCVEIIKQNCDTPSVYKELVDSKGGGFHHWGVFTDEFDADVARYEEQALDRAFAGSVSNGADTRFAYMDAVDTMGGFIELIDRTSAASGLFEFLETQARDWDGSDPIRPFPEG